MIVVCVAAAGGLLASWIVKSKAPQTKDMEQILNRIEMGWSSRLFPYVAETNKYTEKYGDEELWREMGIRGVWAMYRNAGSLLTLVSIAASSCPELSEDYERAWWDALCIRVKALKCLIWAFLHLIFHKMPRYTARECVSVYCDLCATVEVAISVSNPQLKQRVTYNF